MSSDYYVAHELGHAWRVVRVCGISLTEEGYKA